MGAHPHAPRRDFAEQGVQFRAVATLVNRIDPNEHAIKRGEPCAHGVGNVVLVDHGLRIHESDRDLWPKLAVGFEAAIVGWGSYMHIAGRRSRVAFLTEARAALPVGAPILLSFFVRRGTSIRFRVVVGVGNLLRRLRRRELLEPGDSLSPLFAHSFTRDEIARELDDAGFELVYYGAEPYGHAVGRVCVR